MLLSSCGYSDFSEQSFFCMVSQRKTEIKGFILVIINNVFIERVDSI